MNAKCFPLQSHCFARLKAASAVGAVIAHALLALPDLTAADGAWSLSTSGGLWSNANNWSGGIVADGADFTANFSALDLTVANTVNLDSARTIGNLMFGDTASTFYGWTLANNGNAANILTLAGAAPTITVNNATTTITAQLSGTSGLTKAGSATLILAGTNGTYSGGTRIDAGTLQIGTNSVNGLLGDGAVSIASGATLSFVGVNGTKTVTNTISGAGRLSKSASATTVILTGQNTFTGGVTIIAGALQARDSTRYIGNANVTNNGGLGLSTPGTVAVTMSGSGLGTLQLRANGQDDSTAQTLTFFSNYASATASQQTLTMSVGGGGGSYTVDVDRESGSGTGKTIEIEGYSSLIREGTLNVTGANGYALRLDTLQLANGIAGARYTLNPTTGILSLGNVTASSASTLVLDGSGAGNTITGAVANNSGSNFTSITKSNTGTWTLSGNNTYSGVTTVTNGTLILGSTDTLLLATGQVEVSGGRLSSAVENANIGGNIVVSGGTMDIGGAAASSFTLSAGKNFSLTSGSLELTLASATAFDRIIGTGTFTISGGIIDLLNSVTDYSATYQILSGFASGSVANLSITSYDTSAYLAELSSSGALTFVAIPEPSIVSFAILGCLAAALALRRRKPQS